MLLQRVRDRVRSLFDTLGDIRREQDRLSAQLDALTTLVQRFSHDSREKLAREVVEQVGYRGDGRNSLYRAFVGAEEPIASPPAPVPFTSTLCQQAHFGLDPYRYWVRALKDRPQYQRKQWEFVYIAQVLFERGCLASGRRGLVFGAGQEPLPALFASFGVEIVATDQSAEAAAEGGWARTDQHTYDRSALNTRGICTERMFDALVSYRQVDMNAVPAALEGGFDFCWSACALEHLGSLQHGLDFIEASLRTLRSGGVAVHTTEFNLSSDTHTLESPGLSLYRRRDIDALIARLNAKGYRASPMDWTQGEGFAETVVDLPPFDGRGEPHIRLKIDEYDVTSIGLIIETP